MSTQSFEQIAQHEIANRRRGNLYLIALLFAIAVVVIGVVVSL